MILWIWCMLSQVFHVLLLFSIKKDLQLASSHYIHPYWGHLHPDLGRSQSLFSSGWAHTASLTSIIWTGLESVYQTFWSQHCCKCIFCLPWLLQSLGSQSFVPEWCQVIHNGLQAVLCVWFLSAPKMAKCKCCVPRPAQAHPGSVCLCKWPHRTSSVHE